jgi:hypothetical protein
LKVSFIYVLKSKEIYVHLEGFICLCIEITGNESFMYRNIYVSKSKEMNHLCIEMFMYRNQRKFIRVLKVSFIFYLYQNQRK